ncbi:MAG: cell division protein FtsX [Alphaproteobacteria bacterium]|jgi:cell division transport system permease protein|nr:hypothetical protein [Alphaproteobacteria bacterium]
MHNLPKRIEEVPFGQVSSTKIVPWIVAAMVYLIILALGASAYLGVFIDRFQKGLDGGLTVEVLAGDPGLGQREIAQKTIMDRHKKILEALPRFPGVMSAQMLGTTYLESLVSPWTERMRDPLFVKPQMIHVTVTPGKKIDTKALQKYLHQVASGVVVYEVHPWKEKLLTMAWNLFFMTMAFGGLICVAAMGTIAFVTHSGLVIHERIIHILRLIGATNRYISKHFEVYALSLSLRGSLWGTLPAALTFWAVLGPPTDAHLGDTLNVWGVLLLSPLVMSMLTLVCARVSVTWTLSKGAL